MKLRNLILLLVTMLTGLYLHGQSASLDNRFFVTINAAIEVRNMRDYTALSLDKKKMNAEALYLLDLKASETEGISNVVRLAVAASATQTFANYIATIPVPSQDFESFVASSDLTAALFLLDDSQKMLDRTPVPQAFLNVGGPDFKIVETDSSEVKAAKTKAHAEYERRIAENNQASEEINDRSRVKYSIDLLENAIRIKITYLEAIGRAESFKKTIGASPLPESLKVKLLDQHK